MNTLYYGDNLNILREYIAAESVDLIYLDPPFNSNRNYNVLFRNESGTEAESQITAFEDTWHWNESAEATYHELVLASDAVGQMIESFRGFIGTNQMMAYLVMMAIRLKELHRVLKPTGSLYLHCDPTASHYLKILLDTIFGKENFKNEIVWQRTNAKGLAFTRFASNHDIIFRYARSETNTTWNSQYTPHNPDYLEKFYRFTEEKTGRRYRLADLTNPNKNRPNLTYEFLGVTRVWRWTRERMQQAYDDGLVVQSKEGAVPALKRFLDEQEGNPVGDVWTDLLPVQSQAKETLGYPTQKPVALLERILKASSNEGDVVLDPFCGCGTTIAAAQNLNRQWIGIDITHLAVGLQKFRLKETFGMLPLGTKTTKSSPPYEGGVAPASGDGVVLSKTTEQASPTQDKPAHTETKNHPVGETPPPLLRKEGSLEYRVIGQPEDLEGARNLAENDRYGFQWWVLPLVGARALGAEAGKKEGKKGSDKGIDGTMAFIDDNSGKSKKIIFSVKSGHVNVSHIRDLGHVVEREKAAIGVYITLEPPTKPMITEAVSAGFYHSDFFNKDYPRIQILTVEDILAGRGVSMPSDSVTFKKAAKEAFSHKAQQTMFTDTEAEDGE